VWCISHGGDYQPLLTGESEEAEGARPHPKNINVRAAFIHVIGDIIQSLGVLLASIIIKLKVLACCLSLSFLWVL